MKIKFLQFIYWFKNLFSKNGRKDNYFMAAAKRLRKVAIKKIKSRREAKQAVIDYVRNVQRGPKKSNYELTELCKRKGLELDEDGNVVSPSLFSQLGLAGVRTNWRQMKFLN